MTTFQKSRLRLSDRRPSPQCKLRSPGRHGPQTSDFFFPVTYLSTCQILSPAKCGRLPRFAACVRRAESNYCYHLSMFTVTN